MKTFLIVLAVCVVLPAWAAKIKDPKCSDVTTVTPEYLAVIDGYDHAGKLTSETLDMGGLVSEAKKVNDTCAHDKSAKIANVRKEIKGTQSAPTGQAFNPTSAKCSEFVALGEDVQPVAVYWVAGHNKAGKLRRGEVDEEFLTRPVATLVEDCKAEPSASFYDKTKTWVRKHL